jgi:aspartate racemase
MPKTIGIMGGMGPAATVDLFDRIVRATPAKRDQDHLHILINNDPSVPDRSQAILHGGADPLPVMQTGIGLLVDMGAQLIAIPCNTAHYYWAQLQAGTRAPVLNMITETVQFIRQELPRVKQVGILATSGTLAVGLYQDALASAGLMPVTPTADETEQIMEAIYGPQGVKAGHTNGRPRTLLMAAGRALIDRGAEALILGCTEIPLALHAEDLPTPLVASNQVLAEAAVREALGGG